MIRITSPPKPRDRFGSIPISDGKPGHTFSSNPHPPRRPKKNFLWTWLKRIVGLLLGVIFLLVLASPLLIPYLATTVLAEHLSAILKRPVTIPRGEFSPFTCTLTLHNLIVGPDLAKPRDPVDPLLSTGKMTITLEPQRLLDREVAFSFRAAHSFLHLVREKDGSYNTGQLMTTLFSGMPLLPLRFSCRAIAFSDSRLVFDDMPNGKSHLAEDISLNITPDSKGPDATASFHLQTTINGTTIVWSDTAGILAIPGQTPAPDLAANAAPPATGEQVNAGAPDDPAQKKAEAIALVQELSQTVRQYLQNPGNLPFAQRPETPMTP